MYIYIDEKKYSDIQRFLGRLEGFADVLRCCFDSKDNLADFITDCADGIDNAVREDKKEG